MPQRMPPPPQPRSVPVDRASLSSSLPLRHGLSRPSRLSHGARARLPTLKHLGAPHSYVRLILRLRSQNFRELRQGEVRRIHRKRNPSTANFRLSAFSEVRPRSGQMAYKDMPFGVHPWILFGTTI